MLDPQFRSGRNEGEEDDKVASLSQVQENPSKSAATLRQPSEPKPDAPRATPAAGKPGIVTISSQRNNQTLKEPRRDSGAHLLN